MSPWFSDARIGFGLPLSMTIARPWRLSRGLAGKYGVPIAREDQRDSTPCVESPRYRKMSHLHSPNAGGED